MDEWSINVGCRAKMLPEDVDVATLRVKAVVNGWSCGLLLGCAPDEYESTSWPSGRVGELPERLVRRMCARRLRFAAG